MSTNPVLLAVSHGTSSPRGSAAIAALVAAVRRALPDVEVVEAFVDVQEPDVPTALDRLRGRDVVLVPLLLSTGYHVRVDIAKAAQAAAANVVVAPALGPDRRLASALAERIREVSVDRRASAPDTAIVLCAAGSSDPQGAADCAAVGDLLAAATGRDVVTAFLAASEPRIGAVLESLRDEDRSAVVATYLLAPGYFDDRASEIASAAGAVAKSSPLLNDGSAVSAELVQLVVDRFSAARKSSLLP